MIHHHFHGSYDHHHRPRCQSWMWIVVAIEGLREIHIDDNAAAAAAAGGGGEMEDLVAIAYCGVAVRHADVKE